MTSATTPKTIELYGYCNQHEATALGDIIPGMLVQRAVGGVQAHDDEGEAAAPSFAVEYDLTGLSIDDTYEEGDQVVFKTFTPGSGVYAWLADGVNAAEAALLASNGDGTLKVAAAGENVVAQALEAVDNSGEAEPARIRVETLTGYVSA